MTLMYTASIYQTDYRLYPPTTHTAPTLAWRGALLAVVLILTLMPMVCIIHCELVKLFAPPTATIAGITLAICHTPTDQNANVPATVDTSLFYTVRYLDPAGIILLPPLLPVLLLGVWLLHWAPLAHVAPPTPPPRTA